MTKLPHVGAEPHDSGTQPDDRCRSGTDLQNRFGFLLLGYNAAHLDLLDATGPDRIRRTEEPDTYEVTIECATSTSTLTTAVISPGGKPRLEPMDFRTTFDLPFMPVFSYDRTCSDARIIRMMTGWLERSFLVHEPAILEGINALPPAKSMNGA
ncbi:hypothetical protein [Thalassococcus profundi]|uniref:hypothetical protein n=1 Tax=Thalassococcus profundi TaxID=2282382 RepID=UPI00405A4664